jgi:lipoate-protein ligase A
MSAACRVLLDGPGSGAWNMALDEALAESTAADGMAWLRFYTWSPATLSLGYFQPYEARHTHAASRDCPLVRRASGGGAILHDAELTYSLALPVPDRQVGESPKLYLAVHEALVRTLASFGTAATVRPAAGTTTNEPFLCFERRALGDVLVGDVKIAGSAQRRRRGALLQHGSVLLSKSTFAPELPGLRELTGTMCAADALSQPWLNELTGVLKLIPTRTRKVWRCRVEPPSMTAAFLTCRAAKGTM